MKRLHAFLLLNIFFFLLVPTPLIAQQAGDAKKSRPNILFIAIDDQNDWIGYLGGHPMVKTPNIDRLAERGTAFTNAHCQSPLCNSSRTSLMTGLRPSSTGIYGLAPWFRNLPEFKNLVTLPQHLKANGYRTYSTGKIYHGRYGRKGEEFDVFGPGSSVGARPKKKLVTTPFGNHPLVDWGEFPHKDEDKGDWKVASWAVKQLDEKPREPFSSRSASFFPTFPATRRRSGLTSTRTMTRSCRKSSGTIARTRLVSPGTCTGTFRRCA